MLKMKIEMTIESGQGDSPHKNALAAIEALHRAVRTATEETPAIGGELRNADGKRVGSYIVTFDAP